MRLHVNIRHNFLRWLSRPLDQYNIHQTMVSCLYPLRWHCQPIFLTAGRCLLKGEQYLTLKGMVTSALNCKVLIAITRIRMSIRISTQGSTMFIKALHRSPFPIRSDQKGYTLLVTFTCTVKK